MSCRAEDLYSARNSILHNLQAPEPGKEDLLFPALSVRQKPKRDGWMALYATLSSQPYFVLLCGRRVKSQDFPRLEFPKDIQSRERTEAVCVFPIQVPSGFPGAILSVMFSGALFFALLLSDHPRLLQSSLRIFPLVRELPVSILERSCHI